MKNKRKSWPNLTLKRVGRTRKRFLIRWWNIYCRWFFLKKFYKNRKFQLKFFHKTSIFFNFFYKFLRSKVNFYIKYKNYTPKIEYNIYTSTKKQFTNVDQFFLFTQASYFKKNLNLQNFQFNNKKFKLRNSVYFLTFSGDTLLRFQPLIVDQKDDLLIFDNNPEMFNNFFQYQYSTVQNIILYDENKNFIEDLLFFKDISFFNDLWYFSMLDIYKIIIYNFIVKLNNIFLLLKNLLELLDVGIK